MCVCVRGTDVCDIILVRLCACLIVIEKRGGRSCDVTHRFLHGDFAACRFRFTTYLSLAPADLGRSEGICVEVGRHKQLTVTRENCNVCRDTLPKCLMFFFLDLISKAQYT